MRESVPLSKFEDMKLIFWAIVLYLAWIFYLRPRLTSGASSSDNPSDSSTDPHVIDIDYEEVDDDPKE